MNNCLNCKQPVYDKFCSNCGQKTSTNRFSFQSFIATDFVHGILQLNGKVPYTLKTLMTRPGHGVREYIQGKRIVFFNGFSLLLILSAVYYVINSASDITTMSVIYTNDVPEKQALAKILGQYLTKHSRTYALLLLPLMAMITHIVFRRSKQNYFEHIVLNTYYSAGLTMITLPLAIAMFFYPNIEFLNTFILPIIQWGMAAYYFWFFYQYFMAFDYSKRELVVRVVVAFLVYNFLVALVGSIGLFIHILNSPEIMSGDWY